MFAGVLFIFILEILISGAAGIVIALCVAKIHQRLPLSWWKTAVFSASAFLIVTYGMNLVGVYWLRVTNAHKYYGHPDYDGFAVAILLSVAFEICRHRSGRRAELR
jgi:hypothetical protein